MSDIVKKLIALMTCSLVLFTNFSHGQLNPQTLPYPHEKYVGEITNGKANGQRTYTLAKPGAMYAGQFVNDTFSGKETMRWTNGDKFVGIWQNDSATSGTITLTNPQADEGTVRNGFFKSSSATHSVGSFLLKTANQQDHDLIGKCLGYIAMQIQDKGIETVHSTHQKFFANHKSYSAEIQSLNKSYPSCFAPGELLISCLQSNGVSKDKITLVDGFKAGTQIYRGANNSIRAVVEAACVD